MPATSAAASLPRMPHAHAATHVAVAAGVQAHKTAAPRHRTAMASKLRSAAAMPMKHPRSRSPLLPRSAYPVGSKRPISILRPAAAPIFADTSALSTKLFRAPSAAAVAELLSREKQWSDYLGDFCSSTASEHGRKNTLQQISWLAREFELPPATLPVATAMVDMLCEAGAMCHPGTLEQPTLELQSPTVVAGVLYAAARQTGADDQLPFQPEELPGCEGTTSREVQQVTRALRRELQQLGERASVSQRVGAPAFAMATPAEYLGVYIASVGGCGPINVMGAVLTGASFEYELLSHRAPALALASFVIGFEMASEVAPPGAVPALMALFEVSESDLTYVVERLYSLVIKRSRPTPRPF